jgi:hypothetical protein
MNKLVTAASLATLLGGLAISGSAAATDNGFYVGLGAGLSTVDLDAGDGDFDGDDLWYKAFARLDFRDPRTGDPRRRGGLRRLRQAG